MALTSFVPSEEVRKLTVGSYEHLKSQVESAITTDRERLFGSAAQVEVLGTFAGYALVLSEDSKVFRVKYEKTQNGEVAPITAEAVNVPVYSKSNPDDFAMREAKAYVDAFMSGAKTAAVEHLKTLAPLVTQPKPLPKPAHVVEAFSNLVKGERGWKKVYTERLAQIRSSVQDDLQKMEENRIYEKFTRLYDGSTSVEELPNYSSLVTSDLKYLGDKIESILTAAEKSVATLKGAIPALKPEQKDTTLKMFESFSEDFVADLQGVKKALSESNKLINGVDDFGKIYDVLANELHRYEVAGKFIEKMSRRLSENAATEEG